MDPGPSSSSSHGLTKHLVCTCLRHCQGRPRLVSEATFYRHLDEDDKFAWSDAAQMVPSSIDSLNDLAEELSRQLVCHCRRYCKGRPRVLPEATFYCHLADADEDERHMLEILNFPRELTFGEEVPSIGKGKGKEKGILSDVRPKPEVIPKPKGKVEVIDGVRAYVATPAGDYPKDKAVLFLPDILGIDLLMGQLLADDFARNGFKVYMIDYFNGDPVPRDEMIAGTFDMTGWYPKHGHDVTRPLLDKVITALKEQGVTQFAATGYAFGARHTFDLAFDKVIKVAAVATPALLRVPRDFKKFKKTGIPLLFVTCGIDPVFPPESRAQADTVLGGGTQTSELYHREHFPSCMHGFAVRGDLRDRMTKAGREGALKATVEFFLKHL